MLDMNERIYNVSFASIRERKGRAIFYVGYDKSLHSIYLPVPSVKYYHINSPVIARGVLGDPHLYVWIPATFVDNKGRAHIIIERINRNKKRVELFKHYVFDDVKYKRSFIKSFLVEHTKYNKGEIISHQLPHFVFVGEEENSNLHIRSGTLHPDEEGKLFESEKVISNVKKGSVRPAFSLPHFNCRDYLFFLTKQGKPKLLLLEEENETFAKSTELPDLSVTSASENIQFYAIDIAKTPLFPTDNYICQLTKSYEIKYFMDYPPNVKAEDIYKIIVKKPVNISTNLVQNCSFFLLTKDNKLWVKGQNVENILGVSDSSEWQVSLDNVEDIFQVQNREPHILIKTKDNKIYYRGYDEHERYISSILFPYIKEDPDKKAKLLAENVKTYIGYTKNETEFPSSYTKSYFLNTNELYLQGYANTTGHKDDKITVWLGDMKRMEDVFHEILTQPYSLLKYACFEKI